MELLFILRDIGLAVADAVRGRMRRRYEQWVEIAAPRELVWRMLRARDITFEGYVPLRIKVEALQGEPQIERFRVHFGNQTLSMTCRITEERPGLAIVYELIPGASDAPLVAGIDDYIGFVLADRDKGTSLMLMRELTVVGGLARLSVPFGLRSGARRYKRKAEAMAREAMV